MGKKKMKKREQSLTTNTENKRRPKDRFSGLSAGSAVALRAIVSLERDEEKNLYMVLDCGHRVGFPKDILPRGLWKCKTCQSSG